MTDDSKDIDEELQRHMDRERGRQRAFDTIRKAESPISTPPGAVGHWMCPECGGRFPQLRGGACPWCGTVANGEYGTKEEG